MAATKAIDLDAACWAARDAVESVSGILRTGYGNIDTRRKSGSAGSSGVVTRLDGVVEGMLRAKLLDFDTGIGFRGEELNDIGDSETFWLIDPIDGTSHFARGLPFCTTMVSLVTDGEVQIAVILDIANESIYWATKGGGAFCDGVPIYVSTRTLSDGLVSYDARISDVASRRRYMYMLNETNGLFSTISSGYEFAMIASGKLEARICIDPYGYDWDYAPGALLVHEAGGVVRNIARMEQAAFDYRDRDFIAANKEVYEDMVSILKKWDGK